MKTEERERLAVIETEIKGIKDSVKTHCDTQRIDFDKVFMKLDDMQENFAGKWVEKVSIGILITAISGIILFLITNIPK